MVTIRFNYRSARARKARLAAGWGRRAISIGWGLSGLLAIVSGYILLHHHSIGLSLLGVDLLLIMAMVWLQRDVFNLEPMTGGLSSDSVQLECVTESGLLARLSPGMATDQLWLAVAHGWEGMFLIRRLGIPFDVMADLLKRTEADPLLVWDAAVGLARELQLAALDSGVVAAAILLKASAAQPLLTELKLTSIDIESVLHWQQRTAAAIRAMRRPVYFGGVGRDWSHGYTPLLSRYSLNLTHEAEAEGHQAVASVHDELAIRVIQNLQENKPVALVGAIGVGKTALMRHIARRLIENQGAGGLAYYQVLGLDASALVSSEEGIERLMLDLLGEAVHARNTIIYLDEAQLFFQEGPGTVNLTQILLPILQHGAIKLVLSCSEHDWQLLVASQPAFAGALRRVLVPEPATTETIRVLQDAALGLEHSSQAVVLQAAINEAVRLAGRYLPEVAFPGKAITILESAVQYAQNGLITPASIQQAVEVTTGAHVTTASQPERRQLLKLEDQIHQRMINQSRAVAVVSAALRRSRAGVGNPKRPVGSFLFLGPTGVGKTELAKSLAAIYYGGAEAMVRLDMSEYQQESDVSRLLAPGSPKQTGVTLVSGVRQRPSSVVLLDEIEKAHPEILNLLLQLLDEGRITDTDGRPVAFSDAIIIATSNAAADEIRQRIAAGDKLEAFESQIVDHLVDSHAFKPELLNRFDEIVVFRPLTPEELQQVVGLMLAEVNATLKPQGISIALTAAATAWLATTGYDPRLGARPLRRLIQQTIENQAAERILAGSIAAGQTLTLDVADLEPRQAVKA